jgi:hypothetical protein
MRKSLEGPSISRLKAYLQEIGTCSGINEIVLSNLKRITAGMEVQDRVVNLSIDGMTLKRFFSYHAKSDQFFGLPENGSSYEDDDDEDNVRLNNEALIAVIRGKRANLKR